MCVLRFITKIIKLERYCINIIKIIICVLYYYVPNGYFDLLLLLSILQINIMMIILIKNLKKLTLKFWF